MAGFRVVRRLGDGVWEAVQPELDRRVALRRLEPGTAFDATQWPEGPGVVALFAVVEASDGTYVATQFVPGARTLGELRHARSARRRRWLAEAGVALDGAVHGCLTERDVLIGADGRALVTGFGRAAAGASADEDRAALERLRPAPGRRAALALAAAVLALAVVGAAALVAGGGEPAPPRVPPAPPVTAGAAVVGSALAPGDLETVDCEGAEPSGSSIPCTIMQTKLPGRPLTTRFDGVVRGWAVRGASGRISLQILRETPDGFARYEHTRTVFADDPAGTHVFAARRVVPEGARFGIEILPGGAVGIRRGVRGAATERFFGLLRGFPEHGDPRGGGGEELLLRVDVVPRR